MNVAGVLSQNVAAFCEHLREEHRFGIGPREVRDALRAIEVVGISDRERVRAALGLVCCCTRAQTLVFTAAFDTFFDEAVHGVPQAAYAPRHTRDGSERPPAGRPRPNDATKSESPQADSEGGDYTERRFLDASDSAADGWQALRARYSPATGRGTPLEFVHAAYGRMRPAAARLATQVWLGHSRRYTAAGGAGRFDLRGTLRASLKTGGDPVRLRFLRPRRRPRFVMLVDGSRSMSEHTAAVVAFAAALCERNAKTNVFFFSTALREVTENLRAAVSEGAPFADLGEAWGGGTKIGANLARFLLERGALLSPATLVFIYSDGLDVGDVSQLTSAMREIEARSAGIVWLNPHAASAGYTPAARGMRAALPFVSLLCAANDVGGFERLAARIAATSDVRAIALNRMLSSG